MSTTKHSTPGTGPSHLTLVSPTPSPTQAVPRETSPDLVESFAHLAVVLEEPHGILCPCLVCADTRAANNMPAGLIDPWDLIGARWES